jgi:hypothetical protein
MRSIFKTTAVAAGVLAAGLVGGRSQAAGVNVDSTWQSGGVGVTIGFTGTPSQSTQTGAFAISTHDGTHPADPGTKLFDAYCASLGVTVGTGKTTINVNPILALHGLTNTAGGHFVNSLYSDVGNRLEFLLNKYDAGNNAVADVRAALGLAIWNTIDKNFTQSLGSGTVYTLYQQYINWGTNGYVSGTNYNANATLMVVQPPGSYQNLIGIIPPGGPVTPPGSGTVPEPASVISALIGLGAAGLFSVHRARRKAA